MIEEVYQDIEEDVEIQNYSLPDKYRVTKDQKFYPSIKDKLIKAGREDILQELTLNYAQKNVEIQEEVVDESE